MTAVVRPFLVMVCGPVETAKSMTSLNFAFASAIVQISAVMLLCPIAPTLVIIVILSSNRNSPAMRSFRGRPRLSWLPSLALKFERESGRRPVPPQHYINSKGRAQAAFVAAQERFSILRQYSTNVLNMS